MALRAYYEFYESLVNGIAGIIYSIKNSLMSPI